MSIHTTTLLSLPSELIHHILTFLPLSDILSIGLTSRALQEHSLQDTLYQPFVQSQVPGLCLNKPASSSWRELFKTHHPYWFIPASKIWFADNVHTGKLVIARYDPRINAIEGYALVAERRQPTFQTWDWNPDAIIHTFSPRIQLDLNAPIIRLDATAYQNAVGESRNRLQKELPMNLFDDPPRPSAGLYSRFMLTKPWPNAQISPATPVWPPLTLPSSTRTRSDTSTQFRDIQHRPEKIQELSTKSFRTRKWMEFASRPFGIPVRVGEDTTTWATLPEECYKPTPLKPWQGIWCGDYAGHGCEFLAILQPDNPQPLPERAEWVMRAREREGSISSSDSWSTAPTGDDSEDASDDDSTTQTPDSPDTADDLEDSVATLQAQAHERELFSDPDCVVQDEKIYRGRIEAIKLTGDPNIPRGEYTFIAPDIGPNGLVRVATEEMFKGARIVKSVGHIAARGFRDDDFMTSQLILISPNRLAQYWETFGHVSFYERVNIDDFVNVI